MCGNPFSAAADAIGGIADLGGDILGGVGDVAGGITEAIPFGEELVGPALTAWNPLAGAAYYASQGDPFSAALSFAPMPSFGGSNPLAKLGTQTFLQQGGKTALEKMGQKAIEGLTRSALSKGLGKLAEDLGITSKEAVAAGVDLGMSSTGGTDLAGQYSAMTGLGGTDIGPGTPDYPGAEGQEGGVGTQSGRPPTPSGDPDDNPEGWWDWVQKTAPQVWEWGKEHGIQIAAVVAAVYAGMGGLEGEQVPLPEEEPSRVSEKYGTEFSGAPGRLIQGLKPIYSETETAGGVPAVIGYENLPGPQYIGPEREEFLKAQTAAHGGLMSLEHGGLADEEEQQILRDAMGTSPEGLGPQGLFRTRPSVEVNPMAGGGFPRQTGAISGPGTATSDSIPAMLSDGEFVMTSDAVRGAGMGDRMAGAKRMYNMMNKFEGMA